MNVEADSFLIRQLDMFLYAAAALIAAWIMSSMDKRRRLEKEKAGKELLKQFFGVYFHEDWNVEAKDPKEIVAMYVADITEDHRRTVGRAILEYTDHVADDAELEEKLFSELGCYYAPGADGLTARDWLKMVAAQLLEG